MDVFLLGAMTGGFAEYLGMALGNHRLTLLLAAVYLGSCLILLGIKRQPQTQAA